MSKRPGYPPIAKGEEFLLHSPRGSSAYLRVVISTFKGCRYIQARVWKFSARFWKWLPTKVGMSIRRSEIAPIIVALEKAMTVLGETANPRPIPPRAPKPPKLDRQRAEAIRKMLLGGLPPLPGETEDDDGIDEDELLEDDEEIEDDGEIVT